MQTTEKPTVEEICKKTDCYRRVHNGTPYCLIQATDCSSYNGDKTIKVQSQSKGFGNNNAVHYQKYNLCKRL